MSYYVTDGLVLSHVCSEQWPKNWNFGNGRLNLHITQNAKRVPGWHHPYTWSAPFKDIRTTKKLCRDSKTRLSGTLLDYPPTFTGCHPAPTLLQKVACRKKCIPQFDCTHYLGVFYKVQSTTLSSQTLDVVWVERSQIYQVLAPGLCSRLDDINKIETAKKNSLTLKMTAGFLTLYGRSLWLFWDI